LVASLQKVIIPNVEILMEGLKLEQITNLKEHVSTLQKELKQTKVEVQAKNQKLWI